MPSTDTVHRELCHALFDALERGDVAGVERCDAPDMTMWFNVTGADITKDENLAALARSVDLHRRRTYDGRIVGTFDDGFVARYTLGVHDGLYQSREDNLAMLKQGMLTQRKVRFRNRRIRTFEGGFGQQHTIEVTWQNGFEGRMDVCFVGYTRDGRLSRAYEYFDTGQIEKFLGPRDQREP